MKAERIFTRLVAPMIAGGALLMAVAMAAPAPAVKAEEARVRVVFQNPDKFTDVKDGLMESDRGREGILEDIRKHIEQRAPDFLAPSYKLVMTFTDIDLAGEYEPWRTPPMSDVRIVKAIYPPRLDFSYQVVDGKSGAVVREGKEELRDLAFQQRLTIHRDDPLRYEKDMIDGWLRETLRDLKTGK